ncbi:MAG: AAA family ATPase [Anaerolineales bacterium]|nr:AAA family ATPase [Anaerolineales bacterium]
MIKFPDALITRVKVWGFRSLEKIDVDLEPVTVLAGPNGSGKSSFVDALAFLQEALERSPQAAFEVRGGFDQVLTRTGQKPKSIGLEIQIQSRAPDAFSGQYYVSFRLKDRPKRLVVLEENCEMLLGPDRTPHRYTVKDSEWITTVEGIEPQLAEGRLALPLMTGLEPFVPMYNALTSINVYHIGSDTLRTWQKTDRRAKLLPDGSNAASVLRRLRDNDAPSFQRVVQTLSAIVPSIQNINVAARNKDRDITFTFDESFGRQDLSFQADSMSDGTLQVLGILVAIYQEQPPVLVAFEEPEAEVHPGAAAVLAEALQEAGLRTQVLITTHSPDLLSRFESEMIRAVERGQDGTTTIAPIAEIQREAIRRRLFTAGELHRIEGLRPLQPTQQNPLNFARDRQDGPISNISATLRTGE